MKESLFERLEPTTSFRHGISNQDKQCRRKVVDPRNMHQRHLRYYLRNYRNTNNIDKSPQYTDVSSLLNVISNFQQLPQRGGNARQNVIPHVMSNKGLSNQCRLYIAPFQPKNGYRYGEPIESVIKTYEF